MPQKLTTLALGAFGTVLLISAFPGARDASGERPAAPVEVLNFPLDGNRLRVTGTADVSGTVAARQSGAWTVGQSGGWTVGLDSAASGQLSNIGAATAGLSYDADGNLRVSVAGAGGTADPSVANRSPFGTSITSSIPGESSATINAGEMANVTAYSFHSDRDLVVLFQRGDSPALALRVPGGQSMTGSFAHALAADRLVLRCMSSDTCTFLSSVAAY
jgi:hypothetical protein